MRERERRTGNTGLQMMRRSSAAVVLLWMFGCTDFVGADDESVGSAATTSQGNTSSGSTTDGSAEGTLGSMDGTGTTQGNEESSGTASPAVCGDGVVQGDEGCDDGNADDNDACSSDCQLTSCSDGVRNGDEGAVDCGGSCPTPCDVGDACAGPDDCVQGVCADEVCAAPTCSDGVANQNEFVADCGPVCGTEPVNVLVNGDFEAEPPTTGWVVMAPEHGEQGTYFGGNDSNRVVEIDASAGSVSSWVQDFSVPDYQLGPMLELRLRVGDRQNQSGDVGGLLLHIVDPAGDSVPLFGDSGAAFNDQGNGRLSVDATTTSSFSDVLVSFQASTAGVHTLELVEQTEGGSGLDNGGGIIVDDVEIRLVDCSRR